VAESEGAASSDDHGVPMDKGAVSSVCRANSLLRSKDEVFGAKLGKSD
jgi:hypothetical protein